MMKSLIQMVVTLSAIITISFPSMAEELFTASNKETSIQVELFEFESPDQQQRAISLAKTLRVQDQSQAPRPRAPTRSFLLPPATARSTRTS